MTAQHRITLAVGIVAAALSATAVAGSSTRFAGATGLEGLVTRGPITPVCRDDIPCEGPAANLTLFFRSTGVGTVSVRTDDQGRYRVTLKAAIYSVTTNAGRIGHGPTPGRVKVRFAHLDRIDFSIDTGIR